MSTERKDTLTKKLLVANGHKERDNGAITAFTEKSVENKINTKNLQPSNMK